MPPERFSACVAALDEADRRYGESFGQQLPATAARQLLALMSEFRRQTQTIRTRTHAELEQLYARSGRHWGDFDPLDVFVPTPEGLAHVDGMRAADIGDRARAEVRMLRGEANRQTVVLFGNRPTHEIIAAKQIRNADFRTALSDALAISEAVGIPGETREKLIDALCALVDGWY